MRRRSFLATVMGCLGASVCGPATALASRRRFVFRIRTKSGGIVGNIVIEAKDIFAAMVKLKRRYPECEILEGGER